ncbi:Cyclopropane-fatty-acyl-phospholipid synthase [Desulfurella amilsii]|uniref:Cyclopropane-fatty-acyl-phospholipid synthase n=1 Tax=Desulfurella amilsii TaxID=1562698 RepID=A0A1X4XZ73_9BACT|nr:cyclopropane-fatty-acyl-phospholipid synthase family protein [Desulfurella amilsii]OSS42765.1 Cyclopropane-fatty-acyl-phospholipid synthase [Desulfurella amilsii]OSS42841.1 Cyclopropane-fatty-acyl-phospholipid synthase [Desulfurella amilsii]
MNTTREFQKFIEQALEEASKEVSSQITYWDGTTKHFGSEPHKISIKINAKNVLEDLFSDLSLGFGEHYVSQNIEVTGNLKDLLYLENFIKKNNIRVPAKTKLAIAVNKLSNINSKKGAKKNISYHYDLGNDFFGLFLDKSYTYSCAYFKTPDDSLETAQNNKYELICRKIYLKDNDKVVDVGCGFGGFLIYAAKRNNIKGLGCTISKNQYEFAKQRIKEEGLSDKIEVVYEDYRNLTGTFNKFVSIGAYEHIGKNYADVFFSKLKAILESGALGLLHTIGHNEPLPTDPWTLKYIFPGGYLPSLEELVKRLRKKKFYIIDIENLRPHYAKTIEHWIEHFEKNIGKVKQTFDEKFIRMWRLYLNGAYASFKWGDTQLYQIVFSKGQIQIPLYRGQIYNNWKANV